MEESVFRVFFGQQHSLHIETKNALPSQATHLIKLNYYDTEFKDMYMENLLSQ